MDRWKDGETDAQRTDRPKQGRKPVPDASAERIPERVKPIKKMGCHAGRKRMAAFLSRRESRGGQAEGAEKRKKPMRVE